MSSIVLTINAGSSSIKFTAFAASVDGVLRSLASGEIEDLGATVHGAHGLIQSASGEKTEVTFDPTLGPVDHRAAMNAILDWLRKHGYDSQVVAIGHRVVHGGPNLTAPVLIDSAVLAELRRLIPLAPLHEPHHISGIEAAIEAFPYSRGGLLRHLLPSHPPVRRGHSRSDHGAAGWLESPSLGLGECSHDRPLHSRSMRASARRWPIQSVFAHHSKTDGVGHR